MSDPTLETVDIHFIKRNGPSTTDWERFEIFVHCSGTVAVEIGRLTHYTFRQQLPLGLNVTKILVQLRESESTERFGSYSLKTNEQQSDIKSTQIGKNDWLNGFLEQIIGEIEPRFKQQCRDILNWCSNQNSDG